ncbi:MAG: hypothetical protein ACOCN1_05205 [Bacteroidales bacterium]
MQRQHALQSTVLFFVFQQGLHLAQFRLPARFGGNGKEEQQGGEQANQSWHCLLGNIWGIEFGFGSMIIDKNHEKHLASFEALWATQPVLMPSLRA